MPVVLDVGVELALIVAWLVAIGFLYLYRGSLKPFLLLFAALFDTVRIGGFGHYARPLGAVARWLRHTADEIDRAIGLAVRATEGGVVWLWHQLAKQVTWLGRTLGGFAESVEFRFRALEASFPPAAALWLATRVAHALPAIRQSVARVENVVTARSHAEVARLSAYAHGEAVAWRRGIGDVRGALGRELARLRKVEKALTVAGAAALVGAALARLGLGWLRCPRVGSVGKRACGMNYDLLESLLADTLIVAGTVSLVEFAREMQAVTADAEGIIRRFWRAA